MGVSRIEAGGTCVDSHIRREMARETPKFWIADSEATRGIRKDDGHSIGAQIVLS